MFVSSHESILSKLENPLKTSIYPESVNMPFNYSSIRDDFKFLTPDIQQSQKGGFWIIIHGNSVVMKKAGTGTASELPFGNLPSSLAPKEEPLCFGLWQGKPIHVFSISSNIPLPIEYISEPFNSTDELIDIQNLTIAGLGKQILHWMRHSCNCSKCGSLTEHIPLSWGKRCTSCMFEHFPHIHPCSIVLVKRGSELLLTRKSEWPAGRYSLVAGFLDFGESLEECAIREVLEETGISITNVRYVGSQNWPFPSQLMAGFVADYAGGDIKVDTNELEDACWFAADSLPSLPSRRSIARWIIDNFK